MAKAVVAGESLQSRLDAGERFGQAQLLNLLRGVGEELADAHRAGRFHGTITPADICFDSAGEVGLAGWDRDTTPDAMRASRYAPVECYAPVHPQGPWTDVYALGAVLWCAITAEPPPEVLHRKGEMTLARLSPPGFDPAFLAGVDAALEIAPQRRPQTVEKWLAMLAPVTAPSKAVADRSEDEPITAAPAVGEVRASAEDVVLPWPFRHVWPVVATALAAVMGALWATSPSETPPEPAGAAPTASSETAPEAAAPPPPVVEPAENFVAVAPEAAPAAEARAAAPVPEPVAPAPAPAPRVEPTAQAPAVVERTPAPTPAPEPEVGSEEAPRALLARADKRLRRLFGDYARLRADVEDSYEDDDIPYAVKRRAYREGLRIQRELVELRDVRNRIARTGDFQAANRRYDEFEASAAQLAARIDDLRRAI